MSDSGSLDDLRRRIVAVAEMFLSGNAGVIATARALTGLSGDVVPEWTQDPDWLVIGSIVERSDDLPIGEVRELWAPEALAARDPLIAQLETDERAELEAACQHLLVRYRDG